MVVPGEGGNGRSGREAVPHAFVVLGCRPVWVGGELAGALGRRVRAAFESFTVAPSLLVVSGGRTWDGIVEADAMQAQLVRFGVDAARVARERCSLTTRDNARLSAELLQRMGVSSATIVTCDWHVGRAMSFFGREALTLHALPVAGPDVSTLARWHRAVHEWVAVRIDRSETGSRGACS